MDIATPSILQSTRFPIKRRGWPRKFLKNGLKVSDHVVKKNRKTFLLVDNATSHFVTKVISNVTVKFDPPNLTSKIYLLKRVSYVLQNGDISSRRYRTLTQSQKPITQSVIVTHKSALRAIRYFKWCLGTDLKRNNCEVLRTSRI
jgi:hypothetical protein